MRQVAPFHSWRSLAGLVCGVVLGLGLQAEATDDAVREVAIFEGLVHSRVRSCGLQPEDVVRIIQSEIEPKGFRVVDRSENPRGGVIRVHISTVEHKNGMSAWAVRLELHEMARLERDPGRLARATTWDNQSSLTIGKSTGMCQSIEDKLRTYARALADDRLRDTHADSP